MQGGAWAKPLVPLEVQSVLKEAENELPRPQGSIAFRTGEYQKGAGPTRV